MVAYGVFSTGNINSYCSVEQVLALLVGYDLARIGDSEAVAARIQQLLAVTRQAVDGVAGRDFAWHADDEITVDGSGTDQLSLAPLGIVPISTVQQITIAEREVPADDYVLYGEAGEIRLRPAARVGSCFPSGLQNIALVLDWGYPDVPAKVSMAQAKLTAAQILAEAAGETSQTESVRIGDYAVRYARQGKYGAVIERLTQEASEALQPYRGIGMAAV